MEQGEIPNATGTVSVRPYLSAGYRVWTKVSHSEHRSGEGGIRTQEAQASITQVRRLTLSQISTGKESRVMCCAREYRTCRLLHRSRRFLFCDFNVRSAQPDAEIDSLLPKVCFSLTSGMILCRRLLIGGRVNGRAFLYSEDFRRYVLCSAPI